MTGLSLCNSCSTLKDIRATIWGVSKQHATVQENRVGLAVYLWQCLLVLWPSGRVLVSWEIKHWVLSLTENANLTNSVQWNLVQFSSSQFNESILRSVTFNFSYIQFSSVQSNSVPFNSIHRLVDRNIANQYTVLLLFVDVVSIPESIWDLEVICGK